MELIQQKLRELEIMAHQMHVPMEQVINLIERQFLLAAIQRHKGNVNLIAADIGLGTGAVYSRQRKLLRRA